MDSVGWPGLAAPCTWHALQLCDLCPCTCVQMMLSTPLHAQVELAGRMSTRYATWSWGLGSNTTTLHSNRPAHVSTDQSMTATEFCPPQVQLHSPVRPTCEPHLIMNAMCPPLAQCCAVTHRGVFALQVNTKVDMRFELDKAGWIPDDVKEAIQRAVSHSLGTTWSMPHHTIVRQRLHGVAALVCCWPPATLWLHWWALGCLHTAALPTIVADGQPPIRVAQQLLAATCMCTLLLPSGGVNSGVASHVSDIKLCVYVS
jgi:hypothetical protein